MVLPERFEISVEPIQGTIRRGLGGCYAPFPGVSAVLIFLEVLEGMSSGGPSYGASRCYPRPNSAV